jgi:hypothetical protein
MSKELPQHLLGAAEDIYMLPQSELAYGSRLQLDTATMLNTLFITLKQTAASFHVLSEPTNRNLSTPDDREAGVCTAETQNSFRLLSAPPRLHSQGQQTTA